MVADDCEKRVLSVQSHVIHGHVGNKSAVFPLQLLGFECDPINSVQFSNHTGYPHFPGQILSGDQLWELVEGLESNDLLGKYTHMLTGYIGSATFLDKIESAILKLRKVNPCLTYVCDPVLGDDGRLYVPKELVELYRTKIIKLATVLTPNHFELEILTSQKVKTLNDAILACELLHKEGVKTVVLTTLELSKDQICMLLSSHNGTVWKLELPRIEAEFTFSGTGDLTSALLLAWMETHPDDLQLALEKTGATMQHVLNLTMEFTNLEKRTRNVPPELQLVRSKKYIEDPQIIYRCVLVRR